MFRRRSWRRGAWTARAPPRRSARALCSRAAPATAATRPPCAPSPAPPSSWWPPRCSPPSGQSVQECVRITGLMNHENQDRNISLKSLSCVAILLHLRKQIANVWARRNEKFSILQISEQLYASWTKMVLSAKTLEMWQHILSFFSNLFGIMRYLVSHKNYSFLISDTTFYRSLFNFLVLHSLFDCVKCVGKQM